MIAKHHNDEHAHEIALNVARNEKDPKVVPVPEILQWATVSVR